mgnify:CR=1 FL=1
MAVSSSHLSLLLLLLAVICHTAIAKSGNDQAAAAMALITRLVGADRASNFSLQLEPVGEGRQCFRAETHTLIVAPPPLLHHYIVKTIVDLSSASIEALL